MRISGMRRRRLRTATMVAAAFATMVALTGVSLSSAFVGTTSAGAVKSTTCPAGASLQIPQAGRAPQAQCVITSTGTPVGAIKHVWLIILENKSYDETFTGLNQNSYLWQTLPAAGRAAHELLRHRPLQHGQLHLAGVRPGPVLRRAGRLLDDREHDQQQRRDHHDRHGRHRHRHRRTADGCGTYTNAAEPDRRAPTATTASSSCTAASTPRSATTAASTRPTCRPLFNQFNAAGVSWKAYAQDLGGAQPVGATTLRDRHHARGHRHRARPRRRACGYPGTSTNNPVTNPTNLVAPTGDVSSFTGAQPANANSNGDPADQFVAKHFPTGWFASLTGESAGTQNGVTYPAQPALNEPTHAGVRRTGRADERLDRHQLRRQPRRQPRRPHLRARARPEPPGQRGPGVQLDHAEQLQRRPRRDLPGQQPLGRVQRQRHAELHARPACRPYDPEATTPTNYTGGLYAADLFLRYYIPLIEQSAAFKDGGLIDITFDEANPPFTVGNSFNNVPAPGDTHDLLRAGGPADLRLAGTTAPGADSLYGAYGAPRRRGRREHQRSERADRADRAERPRGDQQLG